ncbi:hypothetical protein [Gordonia soli]|uniref:DUF4190 domain-containing protein n=1 Tax=Gordonia soli NBRC 108243 TaxID=1223545 RepID=M0QFW1_9ACTN|nr:hypothetical protein [Gordonia soli]GAC66287.1 hypothetical protein GS4_01_00890 [Gordonia soli NBRC 108243]
MRATDHPTHPIEPPVTDRHRIWPTSLDTDPERLGPLPESRHATLIDTSAPAWASEWADAPRPRTDGPLPAVGDYWDLEHPDPLPVPVAPTIRPHPSAVAAYGRSPGVAVVRSRPSGRASAALALSLVSLPLLLLFGLGAILGSIAVVLGISAVRQISRQPDVHGNGRAITGVVVGTGSAIVGTPFLVITLGLIALL